MKSKRYRVTSYLSYQKFWPFETAAKRKGPTKTAKAADTKPFHVGIAFLAKTVAKMLQNLSGCQCLQPEDARKYACLHCDFSILKRVGFPMRNSLAE